MTGRIPLSDYELRNNHFYMPRMVLVEDNKLMGDTLVKMNRDMYISLFSNSADLETFLKNSGSDDLASINLFLLDDKGFLYPGDSSTKSLLRHNHQMIKAYLSDNGIRETPAMGYTMETNPRTVDYCSQNRIPLIEKEDIRAALNIFKTAGHRFQSSDYNAYSRSERIFSSYAPTNCEAINTR
jgi:hypothetical protein